MSVMARRVTVGSWWGLVRNILLGPGPALHELAHVFVAARYATVDIEPGIVRSTVRIDWSDGEVPVWGVVLTYTAPIVLGGVLLLSAAPFVTTIAALPMWAQVYLAVNFILLAGPSLGDCVELIGLLTSHESD